MGIRGFFLFLLLTGCMQPDQSPVGSPPQSNTQAKPQAPNQAPDAKLSAVTPEITVYLKNNDANKNFALNTAQRFFGTQNEILQKPNWLTEVSIKKPTDSNCAKFAPPSEGLFNASTGGEFRVSEMECQPSDRVAILINLNANFPVEISLTYTAYDRTVETTLAQPVPTQPEKCFLSGVFSPNLCSNQLYQSFLTSPAQEAVQPYFMWIPPLRHGVEITQTMALPLDAASGPKVFTIERKYSTGLHADASLKKACLTEETSNIRGFKPNCLGVVFNKIKIKRFSTPP
jgi:hypothetical protein